MLLHKLPPSVDTDKLINDLKKMIRADVFPQVYAQKGTIGGWSPELWAHVERLKIKNWPRYSVYNTFAEQQGITFTQLVERTAHQMGRALPPGYRVVRSRGKQQLNTVNQYPENKPVAVGPAPENETPEENTEMKKPEGWTIASALPPSELGTWEDEPAPLKLETKRYQVVLDVSATCLADLEDRLHRSFENQHNLVIHRTTRFNADPVG